MNDRVIRKSKCLSQYTHTHTHMYMYIHTHTNTCAATCKLTKSEETEMRRSKMPGRGRVHIQMIPAQSADAPTPLTMASRNAITKQLPALWVCDRSYLTCFCTNISHRLKQKESVDQTSKNTRGKFLIEQVTPRACRAWGIPR